MVRVVAHTPRGIFIGTWTNEISIEKLTSFLKDAHEMTHLRIATDSGAVIIPGDVLRQSVIVIEAKET